MPNSRPLDWLPAAGAIISSRMDHDLGCKYKSRLGRGRGITTEILVNLAPFLPRFERIGFANYNRIFPVSLSIEVILASLSPRPAVGPVGHVEDGERAQGLWKVGRDLNLLGDF